MRAWGSHLASAAIFSWLATSNFTSAWAFSFGSGSYTLEPRSDLYERNRNGTPFIWIPEDDYKGHDFFDHFNFYTGEDPTHGLVWYTSREEAFARKLAYVQDDGVIIMKADDNTTLPLGAWRSSVRVSTKKEYNTGLFILDLNSAPWGCGVWPAWWTTSTGEGTWPWHGEIDIIEGVHENHYNQMAWHTGEGCLLDTNATFLGAVAQKWYGPATNCYAYAPNTANTGCSIEDASRASYGPYFDSQGGGVVAMKWDENGIAIWSFYRSAIPSDITEGNPQTKNWGAPSAVLGPGQCDIEKYFKNHTVILNITFCGDWAGNSYNETATCPGTCAERVTDPKNFVNATWSINSMKVYRKQPILAEAFDPSAGRSSRQWSLLSAAPLLGGLLL